MSTNFCMVVEKCCGHIMTFLFFLFRSSFLCKEELKFGDFLHNPKITFLGIFTMKLSSYRFQCSLFVLYPLKSTFWYQNYVSMTLHLNFMMQNTRKSGPNMRPTVVIYDFSYHIMSILHHACFKVVLLNEAVLLNHILGYYSAFFHFYSHSNITALHFGAQKSQKSCFREFSAPYTILINVNVVYWYCTQ